MWNIYISSSSEMAVKLADLTKSNNVVKSPSLFINHNHLQCPTTKKTPQKPRLRHTGTAFSHRQCYRDMRTNCFTNWTDWIQMTLKLHMRLQHWTDFCYNCNIIPPNFNKILNVSHSVALNLKIWQFDSQLIFYISQLQLYISQCNFISQIWICFS